MLMDLSKAILEIGRDLHRQRSMCVADQSYSTGVQPRQTQNWGMRECELDLESYGPLGRANAVCSKLKKRQRKSSITRSCPRTSKHWCADADGRKWMLIEKTLSGEDQRKPPFAALLSSKCCSKFLGLFVIISILRTYLRRDNMMHVQNCSGNFFCYDIWGKLTISLTTRWYEKMNIPMIAIPSVSLMVSNCGTRK